MLLKYFELSFENIMNSRKTDGQNLQKIMRTGGLNFTMNGLKNLTDQFKSHVLKIW